MLISIDYISPCDKETSKTQLNFLKIDEPSLSLYISIFCQGSFVWRDKLPHHFVTKWPWWNEYSLKAVWNFEGLLQTYKLAKKINATSVCTYYESNHFKQPYSFCNGGDIMSSIVFRL